MDTVWIILIVVFSVLVFAALVVLGVYLVKKHFDKKYPEEETKNENRKMGELSSAKERNVTKPEKQEKVEVTKEEKEEREKAKVSKRIKEISELGLSKANEYNFENVDGGTEAVGIIYNKTSKVYMFGPKGYTLKPGDVVKVKDATDAIRIVAVVVGNVFLNYNDLVQPFKDIEEVVYQTNKEVKLEKVKEEPAPACGTADPEETEEAPVEEPVQEEPTEEVQEEEPEETPVEEPVQEEPAEEVQEEEPEEAPVEEPVQEEPTEEAPVEEEPEEAPVEEPVQEEESEEEQEDEDSEEENDDSEDEGDNSSSQSGGSVVVEYDEVTHQYLVTRVKRSYECKLCQALDNVKDYYSEVKNKLLSYGLVVKQTKTAEKFRIKRDMLAQIKISGKQLALYLALDPEKLEGTKYKGKNVSDKKAYQETPFLYKTKTERKAKWMLELIDMMAEEKGLTVVTESNEDFKALYPSMTEEELIEKGYLVKNTVVTSEKPKGFVHVEKLEPTVNHVVTEVPACGAEDPKETKPEEPVLEEKTEEASPACGTADPKEDKKED